MLLNQLLNGQLLNENGLLVLPRLKTLPCLHLEPINLVIFQGPMCNLKRGFALRCFQRLSLPNTATQRVPLARQLIHWRFVRSGPLVLGSTSLKHYAPAVDKDQPVSRRSKPSSRTLLIGEQPNPWDLLQPQDRVSRHRGAEHRRRYGLLGGTSLLSPG